MPPACLSSSLRIPLHLPNSPQANATPICIPPFSRSHKISHMAQLQSLASIALLPTSTVCVFQVYLFSMRGACRKGFYHVTLRQRVSSAFVSSLLSSLHRRYPGLHARSPIPRGPLRILYLQFSFLVSIIHGRSGHVETPDDDLPLPTTHHMHVSDIVNVISGC